MRFIPYSGDDYQGLGYDENHEVYQWLGPGKILFSATRKGNAISAHFSSNKQGLRSVKIAINEFSQFIFDVFDWCKMIMGIIDAPSVGRIVEKCGYIHSVNIDKTGSKVYLLQRPTND